MRLKSLKIENFKNCSAALLETGTAVVSLTGKNGAGKTNILDAIYYTCNGKSYFNPSDQQLIKDGENYFSLKADFSRDADDELIMCVLIRGRKKVIKRNEIPYKKLVEHYGDFPAIMVAPGDVSVIIGPGEERRKWIDSAISLEDREYLSNLMQYEKVLQQRNAALKQLAAEPKPQKQLVEVYNQMLSPLAASIHTERKQFLEEFLPVFSQYHENISGNKEKVGIEYISNLHLKPLDKLLQESFRKDLALQHTSEGTHRDELEFTIEGNPLKKFGSQGQQKTFLLALKLAQHQYIKQKKGFNPLLLLDDICERLDNDRLLQLFKVLSENDFGQIFLTDTSKERVKGYLEESELEAKYYELDDGNLLNS